MAFDYSGGRIIEWLDLDIEAREADPSESDQSVSDNGDEKAVETKRKKKKTTFREKKVIFSQLNRLLTTFAESFVYC